MAVVQRAVRLQPARGAGLERPCAGRRRRRLEGVYGLRGRVGRRHDHHARCCCPRCGCRHAHTPAATSHMTLYQRQLERETQRDRERHA